MVRVERAKERIERLSWYDYAPKGYTLDGETSGVVGRDTDIINLFASAVGEQVDKSEFERVSDGEFSVSLNFTLHFHEVHS